MAEFLLLVLIGAGVLWLVDRARLQHRLDTIEAALDRLRRESAINRAARGQSDTPQDAAPAASSVAPAVTPRPDRTVPASTALTSARDAEASRDDWTSPPLAVSP